MMKRLALKTIVGLIGLLAAATPAHAVLLYSGSISSGAGTLVGTGPWATDTSFEWDISFDDTTDLWTYAYTFTANEADEKALSHVTVELSPEFTSSDFEAGTTSHDPDAPKTYTSGGSNPGMPGSLYGVKFDTTGDPNPFNFTIVTDRAPVWGDVYGKDGKDKIPPGCTGLACTGQIDVIFFNSGFLAADPAADPANGSLLGHILRPDTEEGPPPPPPPIIPEPSSLLLMGTSLIGLSGLTRRRRRS